jgi:hypothetical protein
LAQLQGPLIGESMNRSRFGSHTEKQIAIAMSVTKAARQPAIPLGAHVTRLSKARGVALSALLQCTVRGPVLTRDIMLKL